MRQARERPSGLVLPLRLSAQRVTFLLLVITSISLVALGQLNTPVVSRFKAAVLDISAPLMYVVSQPATAIGEGFDNISLFLDAHAENGRLREENARLLKWQAIAKGYEQQNAELRALMKFKAPPNVHYLKTAPVIRDQTGPFVKTVLIMAGKKDGVEKDHAVVTGEGLAGRIVEAGQTASRVLLLTDLNSRIPVVAQGTRIKAILQGANEDRPVLQFTTPGTTIEPGDVIVTSGDGGMFPPGILIGQVVADAKPGVRVQPYADQHRLRMLRVLRYRAPQIAPAQDPESEFTQW